MADEGNTRVTSVHGVVPDVAVGAGLGTVVFALTGTPPWTSLGASLGLAIGAVGA